MLSGVIRKIKTEFASIEPENPIDVLGEGGLLCHYK